MRVRENIMVWLKIPALVKHGREISDFCLHSERNVHVFLKFPVDSHLQILKHWLELPFGPAPPDTTVQS